MSIMTIMSETHTKRRIMTETHLQNAHYNNDNDNKDRNTYTNTNI